MCQLRENIEKLIGDSNISEALDYLDDSCTGQLAKFRASVVSLKARVSKMIDDDINGELTPHDLRAERQTISNDILRLVERICQVIFTPVDLTPYINSNLIISNSFPFLDRQRFREIFLEAVMSDQSKILFIEGPPKSGLSYIEKLLSNFTQLNKGNAFTLVSLSIPEVLYGADVILGEKLAKSILNELGLADIQFDLNENEYFKFTQFINKLKIKLAETNEQHIFFLHDFHRLEEENNYNLLELLFALIKKLDHSFPKCILIISGLTYTNIRNWHNDLNLLPRTEVYKIENVSQEHVRTCLDAIFTNYESEIHALYKQRMAQGADYVKMSREDYVDGMLGSLLKNSQELSIEDLGLNLSTHLFELRQCRP